MASWKPRGPVFSCADCGFQQRSGLDPSEWQTLDEFAAAQGITYAAAYSRFHELRLPGFVKLAGNRLLVNRWRFGWSVYRSLPEPVGRARLDRRTSPATGHICPCCAGGGTVDLTRDRLVDLCAVAKYLRTTPDALRKRVSRQQFFRPLPGFGRRLFWNAFDVERRLRLRMFAAEAQEVD